MSGRSGRGREDGGPTRFRLRFWTGAAHARRVGMEVHRAGFSVVTEARGIRVVARGEDVAAAAENFLAELRRLAGTDFGMRLVGHERARSEVA